MGGYVTDTPYADTFFRELSPAWLNYVAALNGVEPRRLDQPFTYLELGCGHGTSAVVNAASYPEARFLACDINAAHISAGREHATTLGVNNLVLHEGSFEVLLERDLPPCDFIVLHGVYSWVDDRAREAVREVVRRLLLPGGLAYVSYNALPGWSHELPLRKLLVELAATEQGSAGQRSEGAARALDHLREARLRYFSANPAATGAVFAYCRGEGEYLAHEFMNDAWEPFYGVDVADAFAAVGLELVGSATLADNHLELSVDSRSVEAIALLPTPRQQALARDFATNQRFRRDVFVRPHAAARTASFLASIPIGCVFDLDGIGLSIRVPRGELRFQESFVRDLRALLSGGSILFGEAVDALSRSPQDRADVARNLLFLTAAGVLSPFAHAARIPSARPSRIAASLTERALTDIVRRNTRRPVPSLTYGNGVELNPVEARALLDWSARTSTFIEDRLPTFTRLGWLT